MNNLQMIKKTVLVAFLLFGLPIAAQAGHIDVKELAGVSRTNWPIEVGVTFPEGYISNAGGITIKSGSTSLPTQVNVLRRWDDNTIRYALIIFEASLTASSTSTFTINLATPPSTNLSVTGSGDRTVSTGAATFVVESGQGGQITSAIRGGNQAIKSGSDVSLWCNYYYNTNTSSWTNPRNASSPTLTVVENGPVRAVLKKTYSINGTTTEVYMYFYANQPWVRFYSWGQKGTTEPKISREIAFEGDLTYTGSVTQNKGYSRFATNTIPANEFLDIERGTYDTAIIIPWFKELGMEHAYNWEIQWNATTDTIDFEWHPIYSTTIGSSPMNANCWLDKYWREGALMLYSSSEVALRGALKKDLELRGYDVRVVDPKYDNVFYTLGQGVIMDDSCEDLEDMADFMLTAVWPEDYPDSTGEQATYNWYSAYCYGSSFRYKDVSVPRWGRARNQRAEEVEFLLAMHRLTGKSDYRRRALLKSRFLCTQITNDGIIRYHQETTPPVTPGEATHYTHRVWMPMYLAYLQTGDPMFDTVWQDTLTGFHSEVPPGNIYVNRNQFAIREYLRLYNLTGTWAYHTYATDMANTAAKTPIWPFWTDYNMQHIATDSTGINLHTNLYMCKAFADLYGDTADTDYWNIHDELLEVAIDQLDGSSYKDENGDGVMEYKTGETNNACVPLSVQMGLSNINSYKYLATPGLLENTADYIDWLQDYGMDDYYSNGQLLVWETTNEWTPTSHSSITDNGFVQSWYYWLAADYCTELIPYGYDTSDGEMFMDLPYELNKGASTTSSYGMNWTGGSIDHYLSGSTNIYVELDLADGSVDWRVRCPDGWIRVLVYRNGSYYTNFYTETDHDVAYNTTSILYESDNDDGSFGSAVAMKTTSGTNIASIKGMDFGDTSMNGRNDLVTANGSNVYLYRNTSATGEKKYSNSAVLISTLNAYDAVIADIDGDGDKDIAYTDGYWIYWAKNNGDGTWQSNIYIAKPKLFGESDLALGDIDGDGDLDMVVTFNNGYTYKATNNGSGTFGTLTQITNVGGKYGVDLGDINNDSKLDLVYGTGAKGYYALGNGNGTFATPVLFTNGDVKDLICMDFDNDGYADVVYGDGSQVRFMENSGSSPYISDTSSVQVSSSDSESIAVLNRDKGKYIPFTYSSEGANTFRFYKWY